MFCWKHSVGVSYTSVCQSAINKLETKSSCFIRLKLRALVPNVDVVKCGLSHCVFVEKFAQRKDSITKVMNVLQGFSMTIPRSETINVLMLHLHSECNIDSVHILA